MTSPIKLPPEKKSKFVLLNLKGSAINVTRAPCLLKYCVLGSILPTILSFKCHPQTHRYNNEAKQKSREFLYPIGVKDNNHSIKKPPLPNPPVSINVVLPIDYIY